MSGRPPWEKDDPLEDPPTISELPSISDTGPVAPAVDKTDLVVIPTDEADPAELRIALNRPVPLKEVASSVEVQRGRIAQESTRLLPPAARNHTPFRRPARQRRRPQPRLRRRANAVVSPRRRCRLWAPRPALSGAVVRQASKEDTEEDLAPDSKTEVMMSPSRGASMPAGTLSHRDTELSQPGRPAARVSAAPKSKAPKGPSRR
jgi:hypothetical protein